MQRLLYLLWWWQVAHRMRDCVCEGNYWVRMWKLCMFPCCVAGSLLKVRQSDLVSECLTCQNIRPNVWPCVELYAEHCIMSDTRSDSPTSQNVRLLCVTHTIGRFGWDLYKAPFSPNGQHLSDLVSPILLSIPHLP